MPIMLGLPVAALLVEVRQAQHRLRDLQASMTCLTGVLQAYTLKILVPTAGARWQVASWLMQGTLGMAASLLHPTFPANTQRTLESAKN